MLYTVYYGDKALYICSDADQALERASAAWLQRGVSADPAALSRLINTHLLGAADKHVPALILQSDQPLSVMDALTGLYYVQEAAGGLVINETGQALAIFRRGYWDLPKGKIDPGETHREAARREVEEETGLGALSLVRSLGCTYHVFDDAKSQRQVFKRTHWWLMQAPTQPLRPQTEEDIEQALWLRPEELLRKKSIYANIVDLLKRYLEK